MTRFVFQLLVPMLAATMAATAFARPDGPRQAAAFYLDLYGASVPAEDLEVARVHEIFARVSAVAEARGNRVPRLVTVDSETDPLALALADGSIVLSRAAIRLCRDADDPAQFDTNVAFVIGHELAHLANDEFRYADLGGLIARGPDTGQAVTDDLARRRAAELAADDQGFVYAAMAGYAMDVRRPGTVQFLRRWESRSSRSGSDRPGAAERAEILAARLAVITGHLAYFDMGVRLTHFGQCHDATYFLHAMERIFPSREVLSNIGFCYLTMAREEMDVERAVFFWMPLVLDLETRARKLLPRRGAPSLSSLSEGESRIADVHLQRAVDYLSRAVEADPDYVPARINLATAYLYLGLAHHARATLNEALEQHPDDLRLRSLDALALYEQSAPGIDLWSAASARTADLIPAAGGAYRPMVIYNLARLLEIRGEADSARAYWRELAGTLEALPDSLSAIICTKQDDVPYAQCRERGRQTGEAPAWTWPATARGATRADPDWKRWPSLDFDWFDAQRYGRIYVQPETQDMVLVMDNVVELQVMHVAGRVGLDDAANLCPSSLRQRELSRGTVYSCGRWAVLARDGKITEAWLASR